MHYIITISYWLKLNTLVKNKYTKMYIVTSGAGPRAVGTERGRWSEW